MNSTEQARGMTLFEMLASLVMAGVLMAALVAAVSSGTARTDTSSARAELQRSGSFAIRRLTRALEAAPAVPIPQRGLSGSYLSVVMDPALDSDGDGIADADNDGDGRVDEDPGEDSNNDTRNGSLGVDEDGDGLVDETDVAGASNDDEDAAANEDPINGQDDDGDGLLDEDPAADANGDGCPGRCSVDDDGDGNVDEGAAGDDDEDGLVDEDWIDTVDFFMRNGELIESTPTPGAGSGAIRTERVLAADVSGFSVLADNADGSGTIWRVELTLQRDNDTLTLISEVSR